MPEYMQKATKIYKSSVCKSLTLTEGLRYLQIMFFNLDKPII